MKRKPAWLNHGRLAPRGLVGRPPQFELPQSETVFNLAVQDAVDGERLQQDLAAAVDRAREAKALETKQQPSLL